LCPVGEADITARAHGFVSDNQNKELQAMGLYVGSYLIFEIRPFSFHLRLPLVGELYFSRCFFHACGWPGVRAELRSRDSMMMDIP
jgi:hypothetical protein